jgi:4-amino-4-deoxy-L-arabinose transferase-like glycosyltransferase
MSPPNPARSSRSPGRLLAIALGRHPWVGLGLLLGLLYVPWLGAIPLDNTLEGNRVQAAREMLSGGDWIVPRLNGNPYLSKPPLHPWTLALVAAPVGDVCTWSARLVSVGSALATCVLVLAWGRRQFGRRAGLLAAFATGTSVVLAEKAVRAELELLLTLTTTGAVLAFHHALFARTRRGAALVVAGLALGAATLVKGPPPLVVFGSIAIVLVVAGVERRRVLTTAVAAFGLALACALAWGVPLMSRMGLDRLLEVFREQVLQRIASATPTNTEPFWYYLPAVVIVMLPAAFAGPVVACVWPARLEASSRARANALFLWGWALLPLLLFSVSDGKESRYLLPTVPAWALLIGWGWTRARVRGAWSGLRGGLLQALSVVGWLLPFAGLVGGLLFPPARGVLVATALVAGLARLAFDRAPRRPAWCLLALALGVLAGKVVWAHTMLAHQRADSPVGEVAASVDEHLGPDESWILVGPYRSWMHFHVARPCLSAQDWASVETLDADVLVAPDRLWPGDAAARPGWREIGRWSLDGDGYRVAVRD